MSILDMSDALEGFQQSVTLTKETITTVDFEEVSSKVNSVILAVVQPAQKEDLTTVNIDWSKSYISVHSTSEIKINNILNCCGIDYKIVSISNYKDYCFYEAIGEEIKC